MQIENPLLAESEADAPPGAVADLAQVASYLARFEQRLDALSRNLAHHDTRLDVLRAMLDDPEVEPYQPIYGVAGLQTDQPRRSCVDRCHAIEHFLGQTHDLRILDVGSSLGYVSFHLADRGASVTGWESHVKNAEVARQIGRINGIEVDFRTSRLDSESVGKLENYDVVLLLSVLHHLIDADGLPSVQTLMADLLDRAPTLILELARKGEDPGLYWDSAQPEDELAIFDGLRDRVEIVKIGEFGNHLSSWPRPMYAVSLISDTVDVNGKPYRYATSSVEAYSDSPMPIRRAGRRYYFDAAHIVKEYSFEGEHGLQNFAQVLSEVNLLTQLRPVPGIPRLLDYEISPDGARLVVKRIPGLLVVDQLDTGLDHEDARTIASQILSGLATLEGVGLRHNDVRSWNVIYDGETASLIDYGLASHNATDDDVVSLLWLLKAVISGEREDYDLRQGSLPPLELFAGDPGLERLFSMVESGQRSPRALLPALG